MTTNLDNLVTQAQAAQDSRLDPRPCMSVSDGRKTADCCDCGGNSNARFGCRWQVCHALASHGKAQKSWRKAEKNRIPRIPLKLVLTAFNGFCKIRRNDQVGFGELTESRGTPAAHRAVPSRQRKGVWGKPPGSTCSPPEGFSYRVGKVANFVAVIPSSQSRRPAAPLPLHAWKLNKAIWGLWPPPGRSTPAAFPPRKPSGNAGTQERAALLRSRPGSMDSPRNTPGPPKRSYAVWHRRRPSRYNGQRARPP